MTENTSAKTTINPSIRVTPARGKEINPPLVLTALMLVIAAFQLNATMLSPAVGDIAEGLGTDVGTVGWSTTIFLAVAAALGIFIPPFADQVGRKNALVFSLVFMTVGTLLVLFTNSVLCLMIGRALQGFCGATFALGNLTLRSILDQKRYGLYIGLMAAINSGVAGVDTLIGGIFVDMWGYKSIFVVILILELLALAAVYYAVPETSLANPPKMDWSGAVTMTLALWSANMALTFGFGNFGWGHAYTITAIVVAIVGGIAFVLVEKRTSTPLVPLEELVQRNTWALLGTTFFTLCSAFSILLYLLPVLSLDEENGFGLSATASALWFLTPFSLAGWATAPLVGRIAPSIGYRLVLRSGLAGSTILIAIMYVLGLNNHVLLAALAFLMGITYAGVSNPVLNILGVLYSSEKRPGMLPGLNSAAFNIGAGVGTGIMASILTHKTVSGDIMAGYEQNVLLALVLSILAFAFAMLLPAKESGEEKI
ncbi:MAG: MFS transporter [Corynebacterium sp.]|nr:MFS transporter [Corynebacterium sp.]